MPKVTMKRQVSGTRNGKPWPKAGETVEVSDDEAASLIRQGNATSADDGPPSGSAPKGDWVAYADTLDVDTDGLTKAEIIDAVS